MDFASVVSVVSEDAVIVVAAVLSIGLLLLSVVYVIAGVRMVLGFVKGDEYDSSGDPLSGGGTIIRNESGQFELVRHEGESLFDYTMRKAEAHKQGLL